MAEVITELVTGLLVLGLAALWIPHEVRIGRLRKELDAVREELSEMREADGEHLA